jgi:uncharacterized protein
VVRWFRALLPREERFFDLYNAHAAILVRAAEALQAMLEVAKPSPNAPEK